MRSEIYRPSLETDGDFLIRCKREKTLSTWGHRFTMQVLLSDCEAKRGKEASGILLMKSRRDSDRSVQICKISNKNLMGYNFVPFLWTV